MNARMLGSAVAACVLYLAPVPGTRGAMPGSPRFGGFSVERGQVAALAGAGLPFQLRSAAPAIPEPGRGGAMYSDIRLKTDVHTMTNALATVQNLRGVTFQWNPALFAGQTVPAGRQLGLIAQETQKILPEVVTTDEKGYLTIQYANIVPVLVEAMKEQQIQLDAKDAALEKVRSDADEAVRDLQTRLADVEDALTRLMAANGGSTQTQHGYVQIGPGAFRQY